MEALTAEGAVRAAVAGRRSKTRRRRRSRRAAGRARVLADLWDLDGVRHLCRVPRRATGAAAAPEPRAARARRRSRATRAARVTRGMTLMRAAHDRRRRRDRRLRLRRRADRADPAPAGPLGGAARARPASALRDRRVDDAAREPPARGAGGSLGPAAAPRRSRSGARGARRIPTSPAASSAGSASSATSSIGASRTTAAHARQLLVAASPNDAIADTHWYRPDFDHWLVREAEREGARYVDELTLSQRALRGRRRRARGRAARRGRRRARRVRHRRQRAARLPGHGARPRRAVDALAAGDAGALQALRGRRSAGTRSARRTATPPYPVDDAAVHHVFPGGWIWILRFANGVTSAGAAVTDRARRGAAA